MGKSELRHPSLGTILGAIATVFSLAALIISLTSNADALSGRNVVRKGDIAPGAVTAKSLAREAIHPKALAKGSVVARALANGSVDARALANDSVDASALTKGAVTANGLARDSVTATALAEDSVTAGAIAPGSVYGAALGAQTVHIVPIADLDAVAENGTWTASNTETAICAPGERLLAGGFSFTNPGNREAAFLQALPFLSATTNGVSARITSNSGGSAAAEVEAVCLR